MLIMMGTATLGTSLFMGIVPSILLLSCCIAFSFTCVVVSAIQYDSSIFTLRQGVKQGKIRPRRGDKTAGICYNRFINPVIYIFKEAFFPCEMLKGVPYRMKIKELMPLIEAQNDAPGADLEREVLCGYTCDLLSWVMAHGAEGMAWVTVQTHMNVIAVAVLAEMACVILPENIHMEQESLDKAAAEGLCVLRSPLSGYEICGRMHAAGVPDKE